MRALVQNKHQDDEAPDATHRSGLTLPPKFKAQAGKFRARLAQMNKAHGSQQQGFGHAGGANFGSPSNSSLSAASPQSSTQRFSTPRRRKALNVSKPVSKWLVENGTLQ